MSATCLSDPVCSPPAPKRSAGEPHWLSEPDLRQHSHGMKLNGSTLDSTAFDFVDADLGFDDRPAPQSAATA